MVRSGFFIYALGLLIIESSGWHYPPVIYKSWDYFRPLFYYEQPEQPPLHIMVDITNDLGIAILQDQSFSKSNFAFSPYGVASVLVVLYEGSRGESASQIQRAVKFPFDKDLIRIGFRDLHRHLSSYFSHEGYLSGIALNKEILGLKPDFKRILNFYGYNVSLSENGNQEPSDQNTSISTAKTSSLSTAAEPFPTAATMLSTANNSIITNNNDESTHGGAEQETNVQEPTSTSFDSTIHTENQTNAPEESSALSSVTKEYENEIDKTTTESEEIHGLNQQGLDNSIKVNETLETTETTTTTTTLANIVNDKKPIQNESDEGSVKNNRENTTNVNENLDNDDITGEQATTAVIKNEINTQGIGAALDNGMLIPQFGDLETTVKPLETHTTSIAAEELFFTSSNTNAEATEALNLTAMKMEMKESPNVIRTTTQGTEKTENNSEYLTSSQSIRATVETSAPELPTSSDVRATSMPPSKTAESAIFTTDNAISDSGTTPIHENLSTSTETEVSQLNENEISSTLTTASTLSSIVEKLLTNTEEITEITSESSRETAEVTLTAEEKITSTIVPTSSPEGSQTIRGEGKTFSQSVNSKKKRSISPKSVGVWSRMSVIAESNTTKNTINQEFRGRRNKRFRIKRTATDYLRMPLDSDLTIHLQNGMYDTYALRNLNFYKNSPLQLFLVNYDVDVPVPMITHTHIFPYAYIPKIRSKALEFPLDDVRYKLLILLPVERRGLKQLVHDLRNCPLREIIESLRPAKVRVSIPMFMAEGFVILTSSLQKLGIRDVFESDKANLSGMSTDSDLYVRNIEQSVAVIIRNYVEILDIQTRTMAARHLVQEFEATHPFVYFVLDTATNVALMAGQILDPLNTRIY